MKSVDKLFELAKHLKPQELSRLVLLLEEHLASVEETSDKSRSFSGMLVLSGRVIQIGVIGGRKRKYFSSSQQNMKYGHELDGGGLFVETNLNANLIINNICIPLLRQLEPGADFEIQ